MTDAVTCPNCRDQLDVPTELRARPVKCATCQTVFTVPKGPGAESPVARPSRGRSNDRPREPDARPRKRGNGIVWLLLAGTTLVCVGLSLTFATLLDSVLSPAMQVHKSDEGKFQVEFPAVPQPFIQTGEKGAVVKGLEAHREMGDGRFFVKYYDLTKLQLAGDRDAVLTDALKSEIASLAAGAEIQRQITTHAGFPAIDVHLEQGGQFAKRITVLRIILAGSRVYILGAQGQNQPPQFSYVQQFFISFQPLEKTKPKVKAED